MTGEEWFQKNQGTAIMVPGAGEENRGQCEVATDSFLHDVCGQPYVYTPNAKDWWYSFDSFPQLVNNFDKISDGSIKKGDIVVYDPISSPAGHIDVASRDGTKDDFWAYDSNWDTAHFHNTSGFPILHEVHHTGVLNNKVLGSLRLKGEEFMYPNKGDLINVHNETGWPGHDLNDNDFAYWVEGTGNPAQVGNDRATALVKEVSNWSNWSKSQVTTEVPPVAPTPPPTPVPPTPDPIPPTSEPTPPPTQSWLAKLIKFFIGRK